MAAPPLIGKFLIISGFSGGYGQNIDTWSHLPGSQQCSGQETSSFLLQKEPFGPCMGREIKGVRKLFSVSCKVPDSLMAASCLSVSRSQVVGQAGIWCLELSVTPCIVSGHRNAHLKEKWDLRWTICLLEVFAFLHQLQKNPRESMLQMAVFKQVPKF